jgi:hypothetical protein
VRIATEVPRRSAQPPRERIRARDPVKLIGTGEKLEDLRPFEAGEFARALIS